MGQRRFTVSELKEYNGTKGKPVYVALKGKVYDVSNSPLWKTGKHPGAHNGGLDLTVSITNAPHGEEILSKFTIVGELIQQGYGRQRLVHRLQKLKLHPKLVHFSMAYPIVVPLLILLYIWTQESTFETASYYMLLFGFLAAIVGAATGIFSWKVTYEGRITKVFYRKLLLTIMLLIVLTTSLVWRVLDSNILAENSSLSYIFFVLTASFVPFCIFLGYYGGKLVYS